MFSLLLQSEIKIDINNATYEELSLIPIDSQKIIKIQKYINNFGKISTIHEILNLEDISANDFEILKKHIYINDDFSEKQYSYRLNWLLNDDASGDNNLSNNLIDKVFYKPYDINYMTYDDLVSIPNVSPMDAVAVLKQRRIRGKIRGNFDLKNSPGLNYYGYKNMLNYVSFNNGEKPWSLRIALGQNNQPVPFSEDGEGQVVLQNLINNNPETSMKVLLSKEMLQNDSKSSMKLGFLRHNNMGDPDYIYNSKGFLSFEDLLLDDYFFNFKTKTKIDRIVLGDFAVTFGQGLVFSSGDNARSRKTGYKYKINQLGVSPDVSESHQYILRGIATQLSHKNFKISTFISKQKRDAIINSDDSFSMMIIMNPRLGYGASNNNKKINQDMIGSLNEITYGANVRFTLFINTHFGISMYESLYDRILSPQVLETIIGGPDPEYQGDIKYLNYYSNSADPEVAASYSSSTDSWMWDESKSSRQITGLEFSHIFNGGCIQAEYAELNTPNRELYLFDGDPSAILLSSFFQLGSFDWTILYRDYDLHYDNPYQRSFYENRRFKSTILEDDYLLEDNIFVNLHSNNPQPQAEKGVYIESRYQFHKGLIGSIEYDIWKRNADQVQYQRIVGKLEWHPLHNYRIYLRYKWQRRGEYDLFHPSPYYIKEALIRNKLRLSNFNTIEFHYFWNYATFNPRMSLTDSNNPFTYNVEFGSLGIPERSLGLSFEHNFSYNFNLKTGFIYSTGYMWFIEDDDFKSFDTTMGVMHNWVSFTIKPKQFRSNFTNSFPFLSLKFKISTSSYYPHTTLTGGFTSYGAFLRNPYIFDESLNYKIRIDYAL